MKGAQSTVGKLVCGAVARLVQCAPALAQCALCKSGVAGANDAGLANSINLAVIFLFIPPVTIFCAIFYFAYRHRHNLSDTAERQRASGLVFDEGIEPPRRRDAERKRSRREELKT